MDDAKRKKRNAYQLKWYYANRDRVRAQRAELAKRPDNKAKIAARQKAWYARNRQKAIDRAVAWNRANVERRKTIRDKWRVENVEAARASGRRRAAERRAADPEAARVKARELYHRDGGVKARAQQKAWRKKNPDAWRKARAKNPEAAYASVRRYHERNRDKINMRKREHRRANPELQRAEAQRRRRAPGKATAAQLKARIDLYGGKCAYCGGPFEHLDHVIPVARGGTHWPANYRPACEKCNLSKGAKKLKEWRGRRR